MIGRDGDAAPTRREWFAAWPWLVLLLTVLPAFWHVLDFPDDIDWEFPEVQRPTLSRRPPPAYRLAEPGDTIDRVGIYISAGAVVVASLGLSVSWIANRATTLWPTALLVSLGAAWHAATPGPTFDGWHGLGWRSIFDTTAPWFVRLGLGIAAVLLIVGSLNSIIRQRSSIHVYWQRSGCRKARTFLGVAIVLVALRQVELPGIEPVGYWPRWSFDWGLLAFVMGMLRLLPPMSAGWLRRGTILVGSGFAWWVIVVSGIGLTWFHRPLARLRTVESGKIYISAMPTYRGLSIAQQRHHFKTIINLFPEDTNQRSPRLGEELRFAREHKIQYFRAPNGALASDAFLDRTLELSRDPNAWPILVHCHGCMDRSPAWMGIYRFLVQGRALDEILTEIERHRGYRPKASVTLLYNRVLAARAPARYHSDPTAALLQRCAEGTEDPYYAQVEGELTRASRSKVDGVVR
jgi:hypothetical protein